jgi:hypothetical protein
MHQVHADQFAGNAQGALEEEAADGLSAVTHRARY